MKTFFVTILCVLNFCSTLFAQDISGFWKSVDEKSGRVQSMVAIYEYQGKYYGRFIGTYNAKGEVNDTIYAPKDRASGVKGHPYFAGLDFIWNLQEDHSKYRGKILDPESGKVYNAQLWIKEGNLVVRGHILFFGRSQTWIPASESDFSPSFKKPDPTQFTPVVPEAD
jgi:uncharacterized protein (DUF2147 family)